MFQHFTPVERVFLVLGYLLALTALLAFLLDELVVGAIAVFLVILNVLVFTVRDLRWINRQRRELEALYPGSRSRPAE